jgi:hypothetical protein
MCLSAGSHKRSRSAEEQRDGTRSPSAPQADVTMEDAPDAQQPPAAAAAAGGEGGEDVEGVPNKQQKLEDGSTSPLHTGGEQTYHVVVRPACITLVRV